MSAASFSRLVTVIDAVFLLGTVGEGPRIVWNFPSGTVTI